MLYWKIVLVDRRKEIESGKRTTSFLFLLNSKGSIGNILSVFPPLLRQPAFMAGQLAHAIFTELPAAYVLYDSPSWSNLFLLFILSVSVWNGGGFYIEVFGRK